ncbi:GNAT family N-acetyltransferase [Paracoccus sp. (in: a-proteobacteria)]|uniref:GNAT family N-acetyltransferase n=1 Tax=Paracoccus sp. TaxID=267 RepID=UPI0026DFAFDD|nr:N-acetyltransferase [Paracoccus sp. (in: a-proteobacteria)]MDO5368870.1 N-acetyltransferase [Paracoccus sp. (in: a-proteobacteria)]
MPGPGVTLRDEALGDADAIRSLITEAFRDAAHASGTEAQIVDGLRAAGALTLSLVAEEDRGILGHVAASPVGIGDAPGWFGIGPLAVRPDRQSQGIGTALMQGALARLRAQGAQGVVLVGDPAYYARFGFAADPGVSVDGIPVEYVLALPFSRAARGHVGFHAAFGLGG